MAKPENGLWKFLRARMPVGAHYSRIEAPETAPGFPDVHYTLQGCTGSMELKCNEFPTGHYPFKEALRKGQKEWIKDELAAGGKVILVLQLRQNIYFLDGHLFSQLDSMTELQVNENASVIWEKGVKCDVTMLAEVMRMT
jgi:hypothetical protein